MVDGCSEIKKVVVADLDGTFINGNTLNMYVRFIVGEMLLRGHVRGAAGILREVIRRKLRKTSHLSMKYAILSISQGFVTDRIIDKYVRKTLNHVNPEVAALLEKYRRDGCLTYLATAAPEEYAAAIASRCGFDRCIATPSPNGKESEWWEARGPKKADMVENAVAADHGVLVAVITDHYDDIPLMMLNRNGNGVNWLVNPSNVTLLALTETPIKIKFV